MDDPLAPPPGYGLSLAERNPPPEVPEHCQHQGGTCVHPVAYAKWIGDISEHVWPLYLCWCCEAETRRIGFGNCTVCKEKVQVIRSEIVADPPKECGEPMHRMQAILDWAGLNPAGSDRHA